MEQKRNTDDPNEAQLQQEAVTNENSIELNEISQEQKEQGKRRKKGKGEAILQIAAGKKRGNHKPRWNIYPNLHFNCTEAEENHDKKFPSNRISTTKYNIFNFIPKNLFEQFRRFTNIFFLGIVIICFIPVISPVTPYTTVIPLLFILVVSAIREGYEDLNRYRSDHKANSRMYQVLQTDGTKLAVASENLKVGDILYLEKNSILPADVLLLKTALEESVCYVETAQLDGETNLKVLKALEGTSSIAEDDLCRLRGSVECEEPHALFYTFHARLRLEDKTFALDTKQLLLRGTILRNTPWTYGVIVYAGSDTKLSLNQRNPPSKFSSMDKQMNKVVMGIFAFMATCCLLLAILAGIWKQETYRWYLGSFNDNSPPLAGVIAFFSYIVLLSFLIPQSLFVTLEIVKVFQARFMEWDKEMMLDPNDPETGMLAKTSSLNDELALVRYIFSDKTGTLTQNKMVFERSSVGGVVYTDMMKGELKKVLEAKSENEEQLEYVADFARALAVCHAVIAEEDPKNPGNYIYQAQSPDEAALVDGARVNGFVFKNAGLKGIFTNEMGEEKVYPVLVNLEFTSERARSSVIVRMDDKIVLYTKGSDTQIMKRVSKEKHSEGKKAEVYQNTIKHLDDFSNLGLRTLLVAKRTISQEEFDKWNESYHEASTSLHNRTERVAEVCELIEKDFEVIGVTAIEDKLQDGVPDTIDYLLKCGMKVWVITGDKQQTAINIGYSTKLLARDQPTVIVNVDKSSNNPGESIKKIVREGIETHKDSKIPIAVVIDGESIHHALKECPEDFVELTNLASAAVCCRVTPLQKAEVVKTIKLAKKEVCLSIGDGANDVSMIQEAHIGIGIFGKEGTQAARSSDYAIQQFSHLKRLLTVHGRYSYVRNLACIHQSFYKNMAFGFIQFWFAFFSGYSAQTIYDDWILTVYNILFTSAPPFFTALFMKDVLEKTIHDNPKIYDDLKTKDYFNWKTVGIWYLQAFYHSWVVWLIVWQVWYNEPQILAGRTSDSFLLGQYAATLVILVVLLKISITIVYWNWVLFFFMVLSYVVYIIVDVIISSMVTVWPKGYWELFTAVTIPSFWFSLLLGVFFCLLPDWSWACIKSNYFPENWMILREKQVLRDRSGEHAVHGFETIELPGSVSKEPSRVVSEAEI
eukprot:TRINITY_DN2655_c0_g1_i1.p1 TRINITY_DN2655_c0_g1~~TRINITY_DN2655_c0_g1_i1.p1  ORF type:complete len:1150 (+),score=424.12 TRINITY_DN2655_c0_g1_i1:83-3532(+)